jgi:heat shock protein HtpX
MATQTFYAQEAANRRNSVLLAGGVALLLGALASSLAAIEGARGLFIFEAGGAAIMAGIAVAFISYRFGDRLVLSSADAKEVTEADEPQLIHVVTEIALAAGVSMPRVYVIEDLALNAFATGRNPANASVAVTRGLLTSLDREELQGVLAHEISHVRNYDIRYALMIGVMVGSIVLVADIFLRMAFRGGGRKSGGVIVLVLGLVLAIVAAVVAKLIALAASRQREYLADASSAELTRNPVGLERALMILATDATPLRAANRATAHLFIVNPLKHRRGLGSGLFSTHPPLGDRIERLRKMSGEMPFTPDEIRNLDRQGD